MKKLYSIFFVLFIVKNQAQTIDTVVIKNNLLRDYGFSQKKISLGGKDIKKNTANLSETLRFSTPIFIKENGKGMVSSPSVRGTSAQQTLFLWNEIPVNSLFLGQGDVNNLGLMSFDDIDLKIGAGSLRFGSGAMGATVHLNNEIKYNEGITGNLFSEVSSFETSQNTLKIGYSNQDFSVKNHINFIKSDNNYEVPSEKFVNRNGNFQQIHYGISAGFRFKNNEITAHSLISKTLQHYPIFEETTTKTKYLTRGLKSQINWIHSREKWQNITTIAYLTEEYDYFENIENSASNGAVGTTILLKNITAYRLPSHTKISLIAEEQYNEGKGYNSGIINPKRNWGSAIISLSQPFGKGNILEMSARKNIMQETKTPFLFSFSGKFQIKKWWISHFNFSKNFRLPTFNDLYWYPGGNTSLRPETAWQMEAMQTFSSQRLKVDFVPYASFFKDMIQWLPTEKGYWSPFNVAEVRSIGAELYASYRFPFGKNHIETRGMYAYTHSENRQTKKFNMYVPMHKASFSLSFENPSWNAYLQGLYNGKTYTTTDENEKQALKPYFITNIGASAKINKHFEVGAKAQNLFNQVYYTVSYYPLPLRNYSIFVTVGLGER